jgi:hypothetical protein
VASAVLGRLPIPNRAGSRFHLPTGPSRSAGYGGSCKATDGYTVLAGHPSGEIQGKRLCASLDRAEVARVDAKPDRGLIKREAQFPAALCECTLPGVRPEGASHSAAFPSAQSLPSRDGFGAAARRRSARAVSMASW